MQSLLEHISRGKIVVADGAMGSLLFQRGLKPGECPEELNLLHPEILEEVARLYLEAGAEIIQTNTFGGSALKLADYGLEAKTEEINARAVECVRRAVGQQAYVSGSVGPCGKILKPYGDTEAEEMTASFSRQVGALLEAGVDDICVETMTDLQEAVLAIQAVRERSSDIPIMATMTFDPTPKGFFTIMGVSIEEAVEGLTDAGADVIGSNCGNGLENMIHIAREFNDLTSLPIIIQSNAGMPERMGAELVYGETPDFFAGKMSDLKEVGVAVIGGCCGTTPDHIAAIKASI